MSGTAVLRAVFGVAERCAPALGAAAGERLCWRLPDTPPRHTGALPQGGTSFTLDVGGTPLVGRRWDGDRPRTYLLHGWAGVGAQLAGLAAALVRAGSSVVVYDQPGHGASRRGRRHSSIRVFSEALEAAVAACGPADAVVAHSLAALALGHSLRRGLPVDRAVLAAPSTGAADLADLFVAVSGSGPRIRRRLVERLPRRAGVPAETLDLPALATDHPVPRTLVVHDRSDPWTPVAGGRAVAAAWPGARLIETTGLGHYGVLDDPAVVHAVLEHLRGPVPTAPGEAGA